MDDNAELRQNLQDLFALVQVYLDKNLFQVGKYLNLKGAIERKDEDRPTLDKHQGSLQRCQAQLDKEKKQNVTQKVTIRQLRKQIKDDLEHHDQRVG